MPAWRFSDGEGIVVRAGIFLIFLLGLVLPADASIPPERFARDSDFRVISEKVTGLKAPPVAYVPRPALFSYDGDSLPVGARMLGAPDLSVRYDRNGLPSEIRMGELSETFTYSSLGELEAHRALFGGSLLWSEEFPNSGGRDKLGRILQKIERYQPLGTSESIDQTFYRYDLAGRLTEEKSRSISRAAPGPYLVRTYQYDASGNRVHFEEGKAGSSALFSACSKDYAYDAQERPVSSEARSLFFSGLEVSSCADYQNLNAGYAALLCPRTFCPPPSEISACLESLGFSCLPEGVL